MESHFLLLLPARHWWSEAPVFQVGVCVHSSSENQGVWGFNFKHLTYKSVA